MCVSACVHAVGGKDWWLRVVKNGEMVSLFGILIGNAGIGKNCKFPSKKRKLKQKI